MYLAWNVGTALGILFTAALPDPRNLGLDLVFPLTFAALLAPLLRQARNRWAALTAFITGLVVVPALPAGVGFVAATMLGMLGGMWVRD